MNLKTLIPLTFSAVGLVSIPSVVCSCGNQPKPTPTPPEPTQKIKCVVSKTNFDYCVNDNLYISITLKIEKENIPDGELKFYSYPDVINFIWNNEYGQSLIMNAEIPCSFKKTSLDEYSFTLSDTSKRIYWYLQGHAEINLNYNNPWYFGLSGYSGYYEENGNKHLCSIPSFFVKMSY